MSATGPDLSWAGGGVTSAVLPPVSATSRSVTLPAGWTPVDVLRALAGEPHLVCLVGDWAAGEAVIAWGSVESSTSWDCLRRPGHWFGVLPYDGAPRLRRYDHLLCRTGGGWLLEADDDVTFAAATPGTFALGTFAGADEQRHLAAVEEAVTAIRAGDVYQVNVCTRLSADFAGDPVEVFARLAALRPAYGAYVRDGDRHVVSASPELFLRRDGREVVTRPIKGTLPRTADDGDGNAERLRRSVKDRAENVMIVDLMRNDLGRVCATGTVRVRSLLDVEPHPGVWHLVSTVAGRLRDDVGDDDLLAATFPPGSVTGAPKSRALVEIGRLEGAGRGVYTGAVGHAGPAAGAEWNVAIRTFEIAGGRIELGVGGGVTADSVPALEWRECLDKAAPLLGALGATGPRHGTARPTRAQLRGGLLETMRAVDGVVVRLPDHLARLDRSAREVYGVGVPDDAGERVTEVAAGRGTGESVVRLVLSAGGQVEVTASPAPATPPTDFRTVRRHGGLWRHKWADRSGYAADEAAGAPLYVAADGAVLETSRGNVFLAPPGGALVTPPLRDDLLPGVMRRAVLDEAHDRGRRVELRTFDLDELLVTPAFWTSSLRGAVPITSVDGVALPEFVR